MEAIMFHHINKYYKKYSLLFFIILTTALILTPELDTKSNAGSCWQCTFQGMYFGCEGGWISGGTWCTDYPNTPCRIYGDCPL